MRREEGPHFPHSKWIEDMTPISTMMISSAPPRPASQQKTIVLLPLRMMIDEDRNHPSYHPTQGYEHVILVPVVKECCKHQRQNINISI